LAAAEAAVATLEDDGASPTEEHVTALRAAFDALVADIAAAAGANDVAIVLDTPALPRGNNLRLAAAELLALLPHGELQA